MASVVLIFILLIEHGGSFLSPNLLVKHRFSALSQIGQRQTPTQRHAGQGGLCRNRHAPVLRAPHAVASIASSATAPPAPTKQWDAAFRRRRLHIFSCIVAAYSAYYVVRNSIYYVTPAMVATPTLGIDLTAVGVISSIFPLTYGLSKLVSGVVGDVLSPRTMLASGLALTAAIAFAFGQGSSLPWFVTLWALNGIVQGWGGPACAKLLTSWFATGERGSYWGLWNISHNFGAFLAPLLAGTAALRFGWRYGVWAPALVAAAAAALAVVVVRDSPEDLGRVSAEDAWVAVSPERSAPTTERSAPTAEPPTPSESPTRTAATRTTVSATPGGAASGAGMLMRLRQKVLSRPSIWVLACAFLCVYLMRQALTTWLIFYLTAVKGVTDSAQAAARISGLELGGLSGSLLAGRLSDRLVLRAPAEAGLVGVRLRVVRGYLVGLGLTLGCLAALPAGSSAGAAVLQWGVVFMTGHFLYGPQMLIGLCGAELVGRDSVGASEGFLGWVAYGGAACAGQVVCQSTHMFNE